MRRRNTFLKYHDDGGMQLRAKLPNKVQMILNMLIVTIFIIWGYQKYSGDTGSGDDLSSSYIGCRLVTSGQALAHLYAHDPVDFSAIGPDNVWESTAVQGNFTGYLHPYVQTPLWAYLLRPACTRMTFLHFKKLFAVLTLASFALTIWLFARYWTPALLHPARLALVLALLALSQPFQYAMFLMQTHVLFFAMIAGGLILAERGKWNSAGFLLAFAAAVKVTPVLIILYWIITRKWKAAGAMAGWLVVISAFTILTGGLPLFKLYLTELSRVGHVLLLSQNNQSLAAWWMGHFYPFSEAHDITIHPLPTGIRLVSAGLMTGFTALGAFLDRQTMNGPGHEPGAIRNLPFGAVMAVLAAMLFAPIAWTHYSILLLAPLMLFAQADSALRSWPLRILMVVVIVLNLSPLATNVIDGEIGRFSLLRGQFYAGLLCLSGLGWLALRRLSPTRLGYARHQASTDCVCSMTPLVGECGQYARSSDGFPRDSTLGRVLVPYATV